MPEQTMEEVTIGELFLREPKLISDEEFDRIIQHYREERVKLVKADSEQKRAPRAKRQAGVKVEINIDDIKI